MTHPLRLLWLCSALFVVLGLGFVFFPGPLASLLTSGEPLTPAALTDLRASYGGTSFGIGLLLGYAALRPRYSWRSGGTPRRPAGLRFHQIHRPLAELSRIARQTASISNWLPRPKSLPSCSTTPICTLLATAL